MNLNYKLEQPLLDALSLSEEEEIWYSVPVDLSFDHVHKLAKESYSATTWLVVTPLRLVILHDGKITATYLLKDCQKIKCEHQVNSGVLTITDTNNLPICAARFSMRHIIRVSYVARGAQSMIDAMKKDFAERFNDPEGKNMYLEMAYTYDLEAAEAFKVEVQETFPGMDIVMKPLSLSVSCHIGPGALAIACSKKVPELA